MFVILIRDRERAIGPFDTLEDAWRVVRDCGLNDANHVVVPLWSTTHYLTDVIKMLRGRKEPPKEKGDEPV